MRLKRTGPGEYSLVKRDREGKLAKRDKAEEAALETLGLEKAAELYGIKLHAGSGRHGELSIEEAQQELGVLQATGRPYKLPGHYAEQQKQTAENEQQAVDKRKQKKAMRALLTEAGIIKTR